MLLNAVPGRMKFRVLIVSSVVPAENRGGGCLTLYRHFCLRDDFEVAVARQYASYACCGDRFENPDQSFLEPGQENSIPSLVRKCGLSYGWLSSSEASPPVRAFIAARPLISASQPV